MKVALVYDAQFPVKAYGGTERVVWWLAKGLKARGHQITLVCKPGSKNPFGDIFPYCDDIEEKLDADLYHYHVTPPVIPTKPYLVTIGGNGKEGESFLPNTVFVSQNHAKRHGSECFVHNGLDPDDYIYEETKKDYFSFLGKASWRVKNVRGAIRLVRKVDSSLRILGGSRWLFKEWRGVRWEGMVGGAHKAKLIAGSKGLLFPVLWNEPFGLAVTESLVSGTPVIASVWGSLPELVPPEVGFLCRSQSEFVSAMASVSTISPKRCREWVMENFTYTQMAAKYESYYTRVLDGERLNDPAPVTQSTPEETFAIQ